VQKKAALKMLHEKNNQGIQKQIIDLQEETFDAFNKK